MKITLSVRQFVPPFKGGVDVYADRLGRAFQRLGHEVSYFAFDLIERTSPDDIVIARDAHQGSGVWRFTQTSKQHHDSAFPLGYDRAMVEKIHQALVDAETDLLIVMNFYLSTLASVEASERLGIPVSHIATDFLPICRRSTLIRWDGQICRTGESVRSCTDCFVSHKTLGRAASEILNILPEKTLLGLASRGIEADSLNPLRIARPYWKQISLMEDRISRLRPLREQIRQVFTPTRYTTDAFIQNGFAPERVSLLPFAVEKSSPLARIERTASDHVRFLFIGRLQPYKGVHILLDAFNNLSEPRGATLDIYGVQDGHEQYFQELQAKIRINDRIRFHGRIEPEGLAKAFATTDFFVLPSIWNENSPLILLDALQSRTPVIASQIGGVTDLIEDGVNGFVVPMGDSEGLRKMMDRVITEPSITVRLSSPSKLPLIEEYALAVLEKSLQADSRAEPVYAR